MKRVKQPKVFILGLTLSLLVTVIVWYWYKSTAAEEGALDLLDRMAGTEARLRQAQTALRERDALPAQYITLERNGTVHVKTAVAPDDLERVKGIGPVFAARLQTAGIHTVADLAALNPDQLAIILDIPESRAEAVLTEAKRLI